MKKSSCVLILSGNKEKVLAVSRGKNYDDFGLPGGKAEPGESAAEAAARELFEETGIIAYGLKLVFEGINGDWFVSVFAPSSFQGDIKESDEGIVRWVTLETIENGSFGDYNKRLLKKLKLR